MRNRTRKSSAHVTLVLLGAAAIAGCSDSGPTAADNRDVYASREDCLADWRDPKECEEGSAQDSRGGRRSYWYGPTYSTGSSGGGYRSGAPRGGRLALGLGSSTRGSLRANDH